MAYLLHSFYFVFLYIFFSRARIQQIRSITCNNENIFQFHFAIIPLKHDAMHFFKEITRRYATVKQQPWKQFTFIEIVNHRDYCNRKKIRPSSCSQSQFSQQFSTETVINFTKFSFARTLWSCPCLCLF